MVTSVEAGDAKNARTSKPVRAPKTPSAAARGGVALPGRILAIDYGRRRIGLAISDELRITARPLKILERKNRGDLMRNLRAIAREWNARMIVVGHPLNLDGTSGEMAEEAARFANRVRKELGMNVELVDERLTSWAADQTMAGTRRPAHQKDSSGRGRAPESHDDVAAAIFLRDYIERSQRRPRPARADKD